MHNKKEKTVKALSFLKLTVIFFCLIVVAIPLRQVSAKECTIYAVEEPKNDNWFNWNAAKAAEKKGYPVVRHKDILDMENKVTQKLKSEGCTCLKELVIVGHASHDRFSVGCGAWKETACADNEYIAKDNKAKWETNFKILKGFLCSDPKIILYGCGAGICNDASEVLHTIAKGSGATVKAPIAFIVKGSTMFDYLQSGEWQYGDPADANPKPCKQGKTINMPLKQNTTSIDYYCPCNSLPYSGLTECINGCSTSLKCFTNICDAYYSNNTWDQQGVNPILKAGASGSWNSDGVSQPTVLRASPYAMWFVGWDASNYDSIGYATSNYGINWTESGSNPVLSSGASGSWEDYGVYGPSVIKDGSTYKMWYTGYSSTNKVAQIGYATSTDGITWSKYSGNPILKIGASSAWDGGGVGAPSVIKDGSTYKMWFGGSDTSQWWQIGYATSTDGITWTKHSGNPVVTYGYSGGWNAWGVDAPSVVKDGSTYQMLCIGLDGNNMGSIGYFSSTDGVSWTGASDNPHISRSYRNDFETVNVGHPALFKDSNESVFKAFYRGRNSSTWAIGYRAASSLGLSNTTTTAATTTITGNSTTTTGGVSSTTTSTGNGLCPFQVLYGEHAGEIEVLRALRDQVLITTPEGQELIELYYQWSPVIAQAMEEDEEFKDTIRELIDAIVLNFIESPEPLNPCLAVGD
jgi:predicted GH43/DUF377 family glycosyl hydrolase